MPLYEFHCSSCDNTFEKIQASQQATAPCPACGVDAVRKVSAASVLGQNCAPNPSAGFG